MSRPEEFRTHLRTIRTTFKTITDEQCKELLRLGVQQHGLTPNEAVDLFNASGIIVGGHVNYFEVLGFSIAEFQNLNDTIIVNRVQAAHKKLYNASLIAGGRPRADGKTEEQWRTVLNQARDTLIDPQKRREHTVMLQQMESNDPAAFTESFIAVFLHTHGLTGHTNGVNSIAYSPDGNTIASGSEDDTIRLWDANTGGHLRTLIGHTYEVNSVAYSPDGNTIASGSEDNTVRLWDANTGESLWTLAGHTSGVNSIAYSPDGNTIASGSEDDTIRLWDAKTKEHLHTLTGHTSGVNSIAYSPDGNTIASGSRYKPWVGPSMGEMRLWDANTGKHIHTIKVGNLYSTVHSIAYSPDGNTIASTGGWDETIHLSDTSTGTHLRTFTGHTHEVRSIAYSPDGNTIASGSEGGNIYLWDANTGGHLHTLTGHTSGVRSIAYSPDGNTIASGSRDKEIRLWKPRYANS